MPYDNEFVIAEVNSDIKYHQRQKNGEFKVMFSDTSKVGKKISTKAVGSTQREDITLHYKYAEGSVEERAALTGGATVATDESVQFSVNFNASTYNIGSTIGVTVVATAKQALDSGKTHSRYLFFLDLIFTARFFSGPVTVTLVVEHVEYNGVRGKEIKRQQEKMWQGGA